MTHLKLYLVNLLFLFCSLKDGAARPSEDEGRANFSSYEMYTTAELLCEIVVRPCKQVSRPLLSSIKDFIFISLEKAPKKSNNVIHSRFLESYVNLVNCLSFADWTFEKKAKDLDSTSKAKDQHEERPHTHPGHRFKRSAEIADLIEAANSEENSVSSRRTSTEQEVDMVDYEKNFDLFFYYLFSITQKICPTTRATFSLEFILPSLEQTVEWIVKDRALHKMALNKYFHDGTLLEELKKCDASVKVEELSGDGDYDPHSDNDESLLVGGNEDNVAE